MTSVFQILFPSRCGKCRSKVYCTNKCKEEGWEAGHKEFCSEAVDERKVKHTAKERRQVERDSVKEDFAKVKEAHKDTDVGKEMTKEVKKMCNEMRKSKKASKSKAAAVNDNS